MNILKAGLLALVASCCLVTVTVSADAKITAQAKAPAGRTKGKPKASAKTSKTTEKGTSGAEAPKADAPKADAPKTDASKTDAPKTDAPKADAPKADAPKADVPKADVPKADVPKADVPKAGLLPIDCSTDKGNPRCGRASSGTAGSGPRINGTSGFPQVGQGFVDGNRLVVAVEMNGQYDDQGAIFGIDLTTGDRTILSGKIEDPARGPVVVGTGPDLGNVRAVAQAGSSWLALVSKGASDGSIVRIDPKTGNRTLETKLTNITCPGSTAKLNINNSGLAAAPDGTAYVAVGNMAAAVGILAFKGATCSVVTMSGANGYEAKGAGPTINSTDSYRSLKFDNGKIWALHGMSNSLMTIDVATGNRARISSGESSSKVGEGSAKVGYISLLLAGSRVWTTGGWVNRDFLLTEVTTATGQRTAHEAKSGPAYRDAAAAVWMHPTKPLLVMVMDNAITLFDPATGNSVIFSN